MPPKLGEITTARVRVWLPPPQVWLQAFQLPHTLTTQSTGQASELHVRVSARVGQTLPACWDIVVTERERECLPPPQVLEHPPQAPYSETVQWIGQGPSLHDTVCVCGGQCRPPCLAGEIVGRER